ncbi:hypothetical protein KUTeg_014412 [Tegillarca granosa]|uniref:CAAX prenyl protease 2 n=1 Tax=Tegillarca granosa TaxID=220873 RepID=A0ABQ9F1W4_TEGGR|nr:hypothetical protein KUTeg_014412 [Tegillarca granosa]
MAPVIFILPAWQATLLCLLFALFFVGSLYIWADSVNKNRDHVDTIKRRFVSMAVVCLIIPLLLWCFGIPTDNPEAHTLLDWMGIRFRGFLPSLILSLALTMVLFMGPLTLHYMDGVFSLYLDGRYWSNSLKSLIWIRNHIVAPFSEEFIFRACMLPILVPAFGTGWAVFVCPLFFGVAHVHHMIEMVTQGQQEVKAAFKQSCHLMAPVIAHAFCNHMGFPAFGEIWGYPKQQQHKLIASFVLGAILWIAMLYPVTSPFLYGNEIYDL